MSELKLTAEDLQAQVKALEAQAAKTTNPCIVSTFVAISNPKVQAILLQKFSEGNVFRGVSCLSGIGIPEVQQVLFQFDCPPGIFCLIAPSFLVTVNFIEGEVVGIQDPYISTTVPFKQAESAA